MAHELEIIDGQASFFSVKKTAWHQLGNVIPDNPTFEEAIRLARIDFDVSAEPFYLRRESPDGGEYFVPSTRAIAMIRKDNMAELGYASKMYVPVQNRDAFRVFEPLLDRGAIQLETGGVLRGGEDAWLLAQFDNTKFGPNVQKQFIDVNDPVATYALIRTNHNGRAGVLIGSTPVRVVCANTLAMAENERGGKLLSIRHTGNANARLVDAAQNLFRSVVDHYEGLAETMGKLKVHFLDKAMFRKLVLDIAAPLPQEDKKFNPKSPLAAFVVARAESKRKIVTDLWTGGIGHTGDHSAWEAYNAVVEAIDHNEAMWPQRGGAWRTASLQTGTLMKTKNQVLRSLMKNQESLALSA